MTAYTKNYVDFLRLWLEWAAACHKVVHSPGLVEGHTH